MRTIKRISFLIVLFLAILINIAFATKNSQESNCQDSEVNYVPDSTTAIKIAEAVLIPIYGEEIYEQRPYSVELEKDVWIIEGFIGEKLGGVFHIEIQKKDCKILKVTHGR